MTLVWWSHYTRAGISYDGRRSRVFLSYLLGFRSAILSDKALYQ